jgi:hypothetical protein
MLSACGIEIDAISKRRERGGAIAPPGATASGLQRSKTSLGLRGCFVITSRPL